MADGQETKDEAEENWEMEGVNMMSLWIRMTLGVLFSLMFLFMAVCLTELVIHEPNHDKWLNIVTVFALFYLMVKEIREMRFVWKHREVRK